MNLINVIYGRATFGAGGAADVVSLVSVPRSRAPRRRKAGRDNLKEVGAARRLDKSTVVEIQSSYFLRENVEV